MYPIVSAFLGLSLEKKVGIRYFFTLSIFLYKNIILQ